jgi:2-polyprenyl-3-methyl-5-hydroxy-6-metoxy-1,4-benzoquinol methylase
LLANQDNPYIFGNPDKDRRRLDTMARLIARYVRDHAREFAAGDVHSILDVGSGEGQLGFALQDVWSGSSLTGVERDPMAVSKANQEAARSHHAAHFVEGDVQLGLPPGPYDLVLMSLILAHTQQPAAVLERAYGVMRPGATLWIMDASELMKTCRRILAPSGVG